MITWRIVGGRSAKLERSCWLAPVAFYPDVAVVVMVPVTGFPAGVGMRRLLVCAWNPDVVVAVPAVVAGVPGPIGVFVRWRRNYLVDRSGWADAYYDLRVGDACGEEDSTDG
jgi:hypothetical protein